MSSESGIRPSPDLESFISSVKTSNNIRAFKAIIDQESFVLAGKYENHESFENDFNKSTQEFVKNGEPCYIMIQLDTKTSEGLHGWLLIYHCPSSAKVRDKMLYASSLSTFKREFGSHLILDYMNVSKTTDINYSSYKDHLSMKSAATPLTAMEEYHEESRTHEHQFVGVNTVSENLPSLVLNVDAQVSKVFQDLESGRSNYLQLGIDMQTEQIIVLESTKIDLEQLNNFDNKDEPRFHIFHLSYQHENEDKTARIFIYTVPGFKCSIKARMIYSSCKRFVLDLYESKLKAFDKKVETESLNEINYEYIIDLLHPVKVAQRETFQKPKRPGRN